MKQPPRQRCKSGAQEPAEPLAGPTAVLVPGGEISHWDRAEGKVSAPVRKVARRPGVPMVLSTACGHATLPRAEITLVGV